MSKYCLLGFRVSNSNTARNIENELTHQMFNSYFDNRVRSSRDYKYYNVVGAFVLNIETLEIIELAIRECIEVTSCNILIKDLKPDGSVDITLDGKSKTKIDEVINSKYEKYNDNPIYPFIYGDSVIKPYCSTTDLSIKFDNVLIYLFNSYSDADRFYFGLVVNLKSKDITCIVCDIIVYSSVYKLLDCFNDKYAYMIESEDISCVDGISYISKDDISFKIFDTLYLHSVSGTALLIENGIRALIIESGTLISSKNNTEHIVLPPSLECLCIHGNEGEYIPKLLISRCLDISKLSVVLGGNIVEASNLEELKSVLVDYSDGIEFY